MICKVELYAKFIEACYYELEAQYLELIALGFYSQAAELEEQLDSLESDMYHDFCQ